MSGHIIVDIAMLMDTQKHLIDQQLLCRCIVEVSRERGTLENLYHFESLVSDLKESVIFGKNFEQYRKKIFPKSEVTLDAVFEVFSEIYRNVKALLPEQESPSLNEKILSAGDRAAQRKRTAEKKQDQDGREL